MENYPRASTLLVSEFKLRREAGSKVSKLWLTKTMKSKIQMCYGKEAAETFKDSHNWFRRFQKRHGIVLRRRTNKKKDYADDGRITVQRFHRNLRKSLKHKGEETGLLLIQNMDDGYPRTDVTLIRCPFDL